MSNAPSDKVVYSNPTCELLLTTNCNMQCKYCIAASLSKENMTIDTGMAAVDYFIYLSEGAQVIDFIFTGGEPFLDFHKMCKLISYAVDRSNYRKMGATITIKTNGTLLEKDHIQFLKKYRCSLQISLDGLEFVHNNSRISRIDKTYNKIIHNLQLLQAEDVFISVSMTVAPEYSKYVLDGVKNIVELGIKDISVAPAYGTVIWSESDINIFKESLLEVAAFINENYSKGIELNIKPLEKNNDHVNGRLKEIWGCQAGKSSLAFLPNGDIAGCSSLAMISIFKPKLVIGNIFSGINMTNLDEQFNFTNDKIIKCKYCKVKENCYGGCEAIKLSYDNEMPPNIYCETIGLIGKAWSIAWE